MPATTPHRGYPYPLDSDQIDTAGDIEALARAVDIDVYNTNVALQAVAGRVGALENTVNNYLVPTVGDLLGLRAYAHILYQPVTIGDFEFPFLNIQSIPGNEGGLVTQVNSNSVQISRTAVVGVSAIIPCYCRPGPAGSGVASLVIAVNGATVQGNRQWTGQNIQIWLTATAIWPYVAGSTFQLQFGAVYSDGFQIPTGEPAVPMMTIVELTNTNAGT